MSLLKIVILVVASIVSTSAVCTRPPPQCNCPEKEREMPVCASNGYTYYTRCEFECANKHCDEITVVNTGPCNRTPRNHCCNRECSSTWNPVCGSDGVTYGNSCEFQCERACNPELNEMASSLQRHYQILKYCK